MSATSAFFRSEPGHSEDLRTTSLNRGYGRGGGDVPSERENHYCYDYYKLL